MPVRRIAIVLLAALSLAVGGSPAVPAGAATATDPAPSEVVVTPDVVYGAAPDENGMTETLRLDLYQPADAGSVRRPAVVWAHGGGFSIGDKAEPMDVGVATEFARGGYVSAAVNYRLQPDTFPEFPVAAVDAQHDIQAAVRYLRAHADALGIDPTRISVAGFSAGAMAALRVGAFPDDPGNSGTPGVSSEVSTVVAASAFLRGEVPAGAPPLLMVHGTDDILIPHEWAEETCDRWVASGAPCHLELFDGATHDLTAQVPAVIAEVERFFRCRVGSPLGFSDVRVGGRAASAVAWAVALGVADGYPDGTFRPHSGLTRTQLSNWLLDYLGQVTGASVRSRTTVTRGQAAMYLYVAAGSLPGSPRSRFSDVDPSVWYAPGVDWLAAEGLASGFADGTFRPDIAITRAQFAGFLRALAAAPEAWGQLPDRSLCFEV